MYVLSALPANDTAKGTITASGEEQEAISTPDPSPSKPLRVAQHGQHRPLPSHRYQLQILHEWDPQYRAEGRYANISQYNARVQAALQAALRAPAGSWMRTAVTTGNIHQVNYRDKLLAGLLIEKLRRGAGGAIPRSEFERMPFDLLQ